jgi:LysM repeat protein
MKSRSLFLPFLLLCGSLAQNASAFTHVVQPNDTLASIAERYYGRIQHEKVLVAANGLDDKGGSPIVPGMRLEVPALGQRRVEQGDTWPSLASELLGSEHRAEVLAQANKSKPWLIPQEGTLIQVPYNLKLLTSATDNIINIAYKFLGNSTKAWTLDHYNRLNGRALSRGDVLLVPLVDLALTADGKEAAERSARATLREAAASKRQAQLNVEAELPALIADVQGGRYVDAVTRGNRFLSVAQLSHPQLSVVHRQLLEAYVAMNATGLATAACDAWRKHDPDAALNPVLLSPKIIEACKRGAEDK